MTPEHEVLHALAMEGVAETAVVTGETSLPEPRVEDALTALESDGYVEEEGFWYVTDAGDAHLNELCRERFSPAEREQLEAALPSFDELDARMKDLASDWQERHDETHVEDLASLHAELVELFDGFDRGVVEVYEPYLADLETALDRLRAGEEAYFTGTDVDSYHEVWFDLHDDLLRTLGAGRHAD